MMLVLWGLQSSINLGMILRTAEVFGHPVVIYDRHQIFARPGNTNTISDFACGALQRQPPRICTTVDEVFNTAKGRLIATSLMEDAIPANVFEWSPNDCIIVGNEYDGVPQEVQASASLRLKIPMPDGYLPKPRSISPIDPTRSASVANDGNPNLNVAVATSILCYLSYERSAASLAR